jgi:hypothetical protein
MRYYQVVIEGNFVRIPDIGTNICGFFSTFYVMAENAIAAKRSLVPMIRARVSQHGIGQIKNGFFRSCFLIHQFWETTDAQFTENAGRDFGFTFFQIDLITKLKLRIRVLYLRRFRKWRLVE